jgi:hypothetical protein
VNDLREEHDENAFDSMCVNSDFVSNENDEEICNIQSILNKEFEHDEELQLI